VDPVSDLMTPDPLKVPDHLLVEECRSMLAGRGVRHLPVVGDDGRLRGILTDYALHLAQPDQPASSAEVRVPSCVLDTPIAEALARLISTTMDAVVVVDRDHRPIGILTEHDVVRVAPALLAGAVREFVRSDRAPVVVRPDTSWSAALDAMATNEVRHLPVMEAGLLVGVISMRDLLASGVTRGLDGSVRSLLRSGPVYTLPEGVLASTASARLAAEKVGCMPLIAADGALVGVVTRSDIVRTALAALHVRAL
jgi:CBS domain-containing protein